MAFAERPKVLSGFGRVVMPARRQTSRWLTIRSIAGTTIRINMGTKTAVARRQTGELRRDPQARFSVGQAEGADLFADAAGYRSSLR